MANITDDEKIHITASKTLDKFKHQNMILKKFGKEGVLIYKAIKGNIEIGKLKKRVPLPPELVDNVVKYMLDKGLAKQSEQEETENVNVEKGLNANIQTEKTRQNIEQPKEKPEEAKEQIEQEKEQPSEEEGIQPENEEQTEENEEGNPEEENVSEENVQPEAEINAGELDNELKIEPEEGEEKEEETEENEEAFLTDNELKVKKKFGSIGLKVYDLIDGKRSVDQIAKEAGLDAEFVINILDYLGKEGIIESFDKDAAMMSIQNRQQITPAFKNKVNPMIENKENASQKSDVTIPSKLKLDVVSGVKLDMELMIKFGPDGKTIYSLIDGKKDEIEISMEANIPLYKTESILTYLIGRKAIMLNKMNRTDIRNKYGDPGLAVYKKYGKEGLMMFALTGKKKAFKDIADMAIKNDKDKAAEIIVFIYQVLGLDLPVSIDYIKNQL